MINMKDILRAIANRTITFGKVNGERLVMLNGNPWFAGSTAEDVDDYLSSLFEDPDYHDEYRYYVGLFVQGAA